MVAASSRVNVRLGLTGQTLIPVLKQRLNKPSVVVDLSGLGLTGITVSGDSRSMRYVGGDYCHLTPLTPSKFAVSIADVAGKVEQRLLA